MKIFLNIYRYDIVVYFFYGRTDCHESEIIFSNCVWRRGDASSGV